MSSAILYVAIVAIWACVLIPRWLRRDSAHALGNAPSNALPDDAGPGDVVPGEDVPANSEPARAVPGGTFRASAVSGDAVTVDSDGYRARAEAHASRVPAPEPRAAAPARPGAAPAPTAAPEGRVGATEPREEASQPSAEGAEAAEDSPDEDEAPPPLTPEESRHRTLVARRRLLGMLVALEAAAITLAVLGLAALWVVIPPSVMLAGYLLLLREAAHADAERAQRARDEARARARAHARALAGRRAATASAPPARTGSPAAAPADYDDGGPGRDFAPGLAGKYTTSNADVINISERAEEDSDSQYTQHQLRAVGD